MEIRGTAVPRFTGHEGADGRYRRFWGRGDIFRNGLGGARERAASAYQERPGLDEPNLSFGSSAWRPGSPGFAVHDYRCFRCRVLYLGDPVIGLRKVVEFEDKRLAGGLREAVGKTVPEVQRRRVAALAIAVECAAAAVHLVGSYRDDLNRRLVQRQIESPATDVAVGRSATMAVSRTEAAEIRRMGSASMAASKSSASGSLARIATMA